MESKLAAFIFLAGLGLGTTIGWLLATASKLQRDEANGLQPVPHGGGAEGSESEDGDVYLALWGLWLGHRVGYEPCASMMRKAA